MPYDVVLAMLKSKITIIMVLFLLLVFSSISAYASYYSGYYTFSASSPISGPSASEVTVNPGMTVNLEATSHINYTGPVSVSIAPFNVNVKYMLEQGETVIDAQTDTIHVNSMNLNPQGTYSFTGQSKYVVPSSVEPGTYTLDCFATATVTASIIIPVETVTQSYSNNFTINVISPTSNSGYTSTTGNGPSSGSSTEQYSGSQNGYSSNNDYTSSNSYAGDNGKSNISTGLSSGNQNGYISSQSGNSGSSGWVVDSSGSTSLNLLVYVLAIISIIVIVGVLLWYRRRSKNILTNINKPEGSKKVADNRLYGLLQKNRFILLCGAIVLILIIFIGAGTFLGGTPSSNINGQNQTPIPSISTSVPKTTLTTVSTPIPTPILISTPTSMPVLVPEALFSYTPPSGSPPWIAYFTDKSQFDPTSWFWSFGDGSTSTDRNPTHVYNSPGGYNVTLTVSNTAGSDSISYIIEINPETTQASQTNYATPTASPTLLLTPTATPQTTYVSTEVLNIDYAGVTGDYFGHTSQVLSDTTLPCNTGEVIPISFTLTSEAILFNHTINSIAITTPGFTMISVSPNPPIYGITPGSRVTITLQVQAPNNAYNGPLNIELKTT